MALSLTASVFSQEGSGMRFPQNKSYGLKPGGSHTGNADIIRNQYNTNYLRFWREEGSGGYFYAPDTDGYGNTTSEAHGFAMIITAIMGDEDRFDKLANYYYDNIYIGNLMNWRMGTGSWEDGTATDGDLDMAYAFLLADKQWPGNTYKSQADKIIADILNYDIDGVKVPSMGCNWQTARDVTRPSDWMGSHFSAFGGSTWNGIKDACYSTYSQFQSGGHGSSSTGLISDFVEYGNPSGKANEAGANDLKYFTNACRVPMRFAMDYATTGDSRANSALDKILGWLSSDCSDDASNIGAGYELNGTKLSSEAGLEYVAPFGAGLIATDNKTFMDDIWGELQETWMHNYDGDSATAYGEAIATLSMLVMTGNFWKPTDSDTYKEDYIDTNGVVLDNFGNGFGDDNAQAHLGAARGVAWGDENKGGAPAGDSTYYVGGSYWYGYAGKDAFIKSAGGDVIFNEGDNLDAPTDKIVTNNKLDITFELKGGNSSEYDYAGIGVSLGADIQASGDTAISTDKKSDLSNMTAITIRYKSSHGLRMGLETEKVTALAESSPSDAWVSDFGWDLPASPDEFVQTEFKIEDLKPATGSILDSLIKADAGSWGWDADGNANKVSAFGITASEDADKGASITLQIEEIILVKMKYTDFGFTYREPTPNSIAGTTKSLSKNGWSAFTKGNAVGIKFNGKLDASKVEATLYNAIGKRIASTSNDVKKGANKLMFNNANLSNGRYFVKVKAGDKISTSAFNFVK